MTGRRDRPARASDPARNAQFGRRWTEHDALQPIGPIAANIVHDVALRAISHWLREADPLDGEDRETCLQTADAIMRAAGLCWADIDLRRAA